MHVIATIVDKMNRGRRSLLESMVDLGRVTRMTSTK